MEYILGKRFWLWGQFLTSEEGRVNTVKMNSKEQREISVNISFSWQKGYKILLGISTKDVVLNACLNV